MPGNSNSGRRPQPTALKILRGNPGRRRLNPDEPQPAAVSSSFDEPPRELAGNARARAEWRRVAPILRMCGLVTESERSVLTAYCLEWSTYLHAQGELRKRRLVKDADGVLVVSPYVAIANKALSQCHWLWNELGLTPGGRAKVGRLPSGRVTPATPAKASRWGNLV